MEREYVTQEAYLAREREAFEKSEYFEGELYPMAGATKQHNRIKENLSGEFYTALKGHECQSFSSDFRVHILKNSLYAYPDLIVVCGELELLDDAFDTLLNPTVLVEINSKTTGGYDKNAKFSLYRDIPSLREYVLIDSRRVKVEVWQKSSEGIWSLAKEADQLSNSIPVFAVNLNLPLTSVYDRVQW